MSAQDKMMATVDRALDVQRPVVEAHIRRVRRGRDDASPGEIIKRLNRQFVATTTSMGAGVGAAAAAPGVGTTVTLALSASESFAFLETSALYVLALADIHDLDVSDLERRRTLFLAIILGQSGSGSVGRIAERTGQHWARAVVSRIPMTQIRAINGVLGRNFVTKYGTKQGIIVLGRVVPFGIGLAIGAGANAALANGVIRAAKRAYGPPPSSWPPSLRVVEPPPPVEGSGTAGAVGN